MRKRFNRNLSELDPNSEEYWNEVLGREGLSANRGRNTSKLLYSGDSDDLHKMEILNMSDLMCGGGKKVRPLKKDRRK
jgi:hypothetical protein